MENVVTVAGDTGIVRDIIETGPNGYIFPVDSEISQICDLIDQACGHCQDIRDTVNRLIWGNFARQIEALR